MVSDKKKKIASMPVFNELKGQYRLIGWDIDTTGKRLGDEICHVAAYYPDSQFSQYIIPHKELNLILERRYKIRVVTVSRYRLLKDLRTNKLIKTKPEIVALTDFISWLEKNKGDSHDGIILVHHEVKKIVPSIFLETLKRNDLFERFAAVVKGFCNTYTVAKLKCAKTLKSFSLQVLSRVLLDEEGNDISRSAAIRAKAYYTILQRVRQGQEDLRDLDSDSDVAPIFLSEFARQFSHSTDVEVKALWDLRDSIERQNSLRPIFKGLMNFDWGSRMNANRLRSKLSGSHIDFDLLQNAWDNGGKKSIKEVLKTVPTTRKKDYAILLKILNCYFDPNKKPVNSNFLQRRTTFTKATEVDEQEKENNLRKYSEVAANKGERSGQSDNLPLRPL